MAIKTFNSICPERKIGWCSFPDFESWNSELADPNTYPQLPEEFSLGDLRIIKTVWEASKPPIFFFAYKDLPIDGEIFEKSTTRLVVFDGFTSQEIDKSMGKYERVSCSRKILESGTTGITSTIPFIPVIQICYYRVAVYISK